MCAVGCVCVYLCFNLTIHLIKKSLYPSFVLCLMIEFLLDKAPGGFEFGPLAKGALCTSAAA